ncbi:2569_t:CDS:1 [Acaulospora morrowiae]|uniref:2569_t:CDS:1 n=1 Tax=Acaulospora morrowiae TaxID=94023 RepID=A0A9N8V2U5_9GLOM|nr:2569_t:CDS:1 [Acaulospora morrowiae]
MPRGIFFLSFLILVLLHIIYFLPIITAQSLAKRFPIEHSPIINSKPNVPSLREKGGGINKASVNSPSTSLSLPTDASLTHQGNVAAEATTKVKTMVHTTVYGVKPTDTGKSSMEGKSSGNKRGRSEGSGMLIGVLVGILIVFLKQL